MARLHLHYALISRVGGAATLEIPAETVAGLLDECGKRYGEEVRAALRAAVILVNGRNIAYLKGLKTPLQPDDEVWSMVPAAGG
ncbi:MAG: MoaD/ThiS family protein [Deltaproteobacteria bacterium]|nr:MoaD/ThiS family protein [Deltaproteobacteria bacterium]